MLTELKSEKNFELAVKIFEISDELCFKENRKYHEIARQQARRTTIVVQLSRQKSKTFIMN